MTTAGYTAAIFIGLSLGLIGGGGSILTVPVLVYLFHIDTILATAYSLFIVGTTSAAGCLSYFKKGHVHFGTVLVFGLPSILSVFLTRTYIVPSIPTHVLHIGSFTLDKGPLLLLFFAILMVFAAYGMIKKRETNVNDVQKQSTHYSLAFVGGFVVGMLTGLIGAGGGFLIIPALVNFLKLSMKTAIGTSLVIITINSLVGFLFSLPHITVNWLFIWQVTGLAIIGIVTGSAISTKINGNRLKPAFGWFVLAMGVYILLKETFL